MTLSIALEPLLEALPLGVVVFDPTGRVRLINRAARELLQAPEDTVERGRLVDTLLCLDHRADVVPEMAYGPATATPRLCVRLEELTGLLAGLRTVVVRPNVSASEVLGPHVAMLGHELRNPLAPLRLAASHLRQRGAEPATACIAIERNVDHLSRIVDDLLDTERATQGELRLERGPTLLVDAVSDAIDACRPQFDELQHTLSTDLTGLAGVELHGDRTRLAQAVSNLLSNAATHTPQRSCITLRGWREGTSAHIALTDDGPGLPQGSLEDIFETFARRAPATHRRYGGLGLGLGLCRHIIELHGGTVSASSPGLGQGSTFSIVLPQTRVSVPQEAYRALAAAPSSGSLVLIVDDNEDAAAMLALVLESQGATCTVTHAGKAALAALESAQFDLAIVDIGLPDIDGFEVARRAHALETRPVRLVALSGYGQQSDRDIAQAAGFDAYYVKPLAPEALSALLDPV